MQLEGTLVAWGLQADGWLPAFENAGTSSPAVIGENEGHQSEGLE